MCAIHYSPYRHHDLPSKNKTQFCTENFVQNGIYYESTYTAALSLSIIVLMIPSISFLLFSKPLKSKKKTKFNHKL